jgi:hypothetical protein
MSSVESVAVENPSDVAVREIARGALPRRGARQRRADLDSCQRVSHVIERIPYRCSEGEGVRRQ